MVDATLLLLDRMGRIGLPGVVRYEARLLDLDRRERVEISPSESAKLEGTRLLALRREMDEISPSESAKLEGTRFLVLCDLSESASLACPLGA